MRCIRGGPGRSLGNQRRLGRMMSNMDVYMVVAWLRSTEYGCELGTIGVCRMTMQRLGITAPWRVLKESSVLNTE